MKIEELVGNHRIVELFKEHHDNGLFARALALEAARAAFEMAAQYADDHASAAPGEYYVNLEEWLLRMAKELE